MHYIILLSTQGKPHWTVAEVSTDWHWSLKMHLQNKTRHLRCFSSADQLKILSGEMKQEKTTTVSCSMRSCRPRVLIVVCENQCTSSTLLRCFNSPRDVFLLYFWERRCTRHVYCLQPSVVILNIIQGPAISSHTCQIKVLPNQPGLKPYGL